MAESARLKRIGVYVNPDDLAEVARELGCRPSQAVQRLLENFLLPQRIDEVRRGPDAGPDHVFRKGRGVRLPKIPASEEIEPVE